MTETDYEECLFWWSKEEWQYYDEPDREFQAYDLDRFERWWERGVYPIDGSGRFQVDTVEGSHIGWVVYYDLGNETGSVFIRINLPDERIWSRGFGTEALTILIDYLFHEKGMKEIRAATWTGNTHMMICAYRVGFMTFERMPHRSAVSVRGEPLERIEFTLSRDEWFERTGREKQYKVLT